MPQLFFDAIFEGIVAPVELVFGRDGESARGNEPCQPLSRTGCPQGLLIELDQGTGVGVLRVEQHGFAEIEQSLGVLAGNPEQIAHADIGIGVAAVVADGFEQMLTGFGQQGGILVIVGGGLVQAFDPETNQVPSRRMPLGSTATILFFQRSQGLKIHDVLHNIICKKVYSGERKGVSNRPDSECMCSNPNGL